MTSPTVARREELPVVIRRAQRLDLERVVQIEQASFPTPWPYDLLAQHLEEDGFLVAELEGLLVGYIIVAMKIPSFFARLERRTLQWLKAEEIPEPQVGHIMNLAVIPAYRKKGLGRRMLVHGIEYLKNLGAQEIELEVRVDNTPALALYEQFDFTVKERMQNYYSNGDDAYLMNLEIETQPLP